MAKVAILLGLICLIPWDGSRSGWLVGWLVIHERNVPFDTYLLIWLLIIINDSMASLNG